MNCSYIEIGGKINDMFRRNIVVKSIEKAKVIKQYAFTDTYSTIYKYDSKQQDGANIIAPLYIDLDANDLERDYEKLKRDVLLLTRKLKTMFNLTDDNIQLFFSGSKGFHIIVPHTIFGIEPSKDLNTKYKIIAVELKSYTITKSVDTRIYDTKRLFREPNTINTKTGLYKVQVKLSDIRTMSYDDLIEYAKEPKDFSAVNGEFNIKSQEAFNNLIEEVNQKQKQSINYKVARNMLANKEMLPCINYILQNGAQRGGRNNTAMALASALYQREMSEEEGLDIMLSWNSKKLDDPLSEREIENTVKSAYRNVKDGRRYGCGAFIDMGICVKGCPIRK